MRAVVTLIAVMACLLPTLVAAQQPAAPLAFAPSGLSEDRFEAVAEPEVVEVEAHDDVVLHARVYRPDTGGEPTPVILVHSPYYNGLLLGDDARSQDLVRFFTPKGYTVVLSDVRGTGNSGGCGEQDGPNQAKDFATLVEHFADQPWSNGRVGSYGKSYDAETQHAGAVRNPRGLETMVSVAGISGLYDVAYFDGVPLALNGVLSATAYELYDLDVPGEVGAMPRRLERHTCQPANFANGADPRGDMTEYWADREFRQGVEDITASTLYVTGLNDYTVSPINLDGWFDEIPTFKRAVIGQWTHDYPYDAEDAVARDDWWSMIHAWFDHELLDLPTGITAWPQVQVQAEDNTWRAVDSFRGMGREAVVALGEGSATFTETGSWSVDLPTPGHHLSGQAYLDAVISLDRPDGHFAVRLDEVRADGSTRQLVRGYRSAVHRESLLRSVPVTPGHPTPYRIRTYPFDVTLDEGSTLRLTIAGSDSATLPAGTGYTATISLDDSALRIPVADDRCGLQVARRVDGPGQPAGCPDGVPTPTPWSEVPRSIGHTTTASVVGSTSEEVGGAAAVREWGYLTMRDGVELAYEVIRPDGEGPHPTLFTYDGYAAGADPDSGYAARYVPRGYALVGVNLRGTGCSGGTFDFFQPAEAHDGYEVVEWAAAQEWSNGRVGMIGKSYPGITQLFVAQAQPPHLAAIAPGHYYADVYRDIANPGGILNYAFAALWSFIAQPAPGVQAGVEDSLAGDATCLANQRHHATNAPTNPLLQAETHPHEVLLHAERSPLTNAEAIDVPVYQALSWQDEQLMSRNSHFLAELDRLGVPYRAVLSNGDHGTYREGPQMRELDRFLQAHLEHPEVLDDGTPLEDYLAEPAVQVFWEQGEDTPPRWVSELDGWGDQAHPLRLHVGSGTLGGEVAGGATSYVHNVAGSQGIADGTTFGSDFQDLTTWGLHSPPPGTAAAFTTKPMAQDLVLLGNASADLWLTATAENVDLQVTLTEVRPDGTEVFINQGWLRAEQRFLDRARSTELLPVQTHDVADVEPLSPTEPSLVRVEVFPFGHVVREGSRLRMWVEAPTVVPQLEGFQLDPTPAQVTIHHTEAHASSLVLPATSLAPVPAEFAGQDGQPPCGAVQRQHCRPDPLAAESPITLPG